MAGVRRFDEEAVLDRVMQVFWEHGYEATSIDDLEAATGLKRGSLYNAFGDKERLFLTAFERYQRRFQRPLLDALEDPDPRRAFARYFDVQITGLSSQPLPTGCLMANALAEAGNRSDRIGCAAREAFAASEGAFYDALRRAQAEGRLAPGHDARALARFFLAVSRSLALIHRSLGDDRYMRDVARSALLVLDAPPEGERSSAS
ncbi:TetR/AcrR family transcriptional regulator [Sorangium sp. So ce861]|uniref:TetR/AcrR family transcriptional regulator n=1 Tax=Sorangium sp. So ce861 TaxID=3133323 RepID=UPI003F612579